MSKSLVSNGCSSGSDSEEFVVERILSKRFIRGSTQYLIKWKGYDETESTWENEKDCKCPKLIREFEEMQSVGSYPKFILKTSSLDKSTKKSSIGRSDQNPRSTRSPSISSKNTKKPRLTINNLNSGDKRCDNSIQEFSVNQNNEDEDIILVHSTSRVGHDQASTSKLHQSESKRIVTTPKRSKATNRRPSANDNYGICNGKKISRILGLNMQGEELQMLVLYGNVNTKHMNRDNTELVPSRIVHQYEPQLVLKYYESLIVAKKS